ncbi:MAG: PH domain-containing protein [Candidatus Izemoplasmataceae bacterium]
MIDFENKKYLKLKEDDGYGKLAEELLVEGEEILGAYKSVRDGIVFTSFRLIIINVQGITGKKKDFTSIPYNKINVYSVETSGVFDLEAELVIYVSSIGQMLFEFKGRSNVRAISKHISQALK